MSLYVWRLCFHIPLSACVLSSVCLFVTLWTIAHQAPLSMGFSRQEYWSGLLFIPPGDLLKPGLESVSSVLGGGFFTTEPPGKPSYPFGILPFVFWMHHLLFSYLSTSIFYAQLMLNHFFLNILYIFLFFWFLYQIVANHLPCFFPLTVWVNSCLDLNHCSCSIY